MTEICECRHDITHHDSETGECMEHIHDKDVSCKCKKFKTKTIGILEMAKRIKDEDREIEKQQKGCGKPYTDKESGEGTFCNEFNGLCPDCSKSEIRMANDIFDRKQREAYNNIKPQKGCGKLIQVWEKNAKDSLQYICGEKGNLCPSCSKSGVQADSKQLSCCQTSDNKSPQVKVAKLDSNPGDNQSPVHNGVCGETCEECLKSGGPRSVVPTESSDNKSPKICPETHSGDTFNLSNELYNMEALGMLNYTNVMEANKTFIKNYEEIDRELWRGIDSIIRYDVDSKIKSDFIDKEFIVANEKKDKLVGRKLVE